MSNNYKRQFRELSQETKSRISQSSTGKAKSLEHKQHISQGMKEYWKGVPNRPSGDLSMDEFLGNKNNGDKGNGR